MIGFLTYSAKIDFMFYRKDAKFIKFTAEAQGRREKLLYWLAAKTNLATQLFF